MPVTTAPVQPQLEDAVNYVQQVKETFHDKLQVFKIFLALLDDFKSKSVDTSEVCTRISTLFEDHSELIAGFNIFVESQWRIVQPTEQDEVSIPGTSTGYTGCNTDQTPPTTNSEGNAGIIIHHAQPANQASYLSHSNSSPPGSSCNANETMNHPFLANSSAVEETVQSQHGYNQSSPTDSQPSGASSGIHCPSTNNPINFNYAIIFMSKIRNHFRSQQDKFKQFLELFITYLGQERQENVDSSKEFLTKLDIYSRVMQLLQNQNDLLQEFRQFLPDINGPTIAGTSSVSGDAISVAPRVANDDHPVNLKKPVLQAPTSNIVTKPRSSTKRNGPPVSTKRRKHQKKLENVAEPVPNEVSTQECDQTESDLVTEIDYSSCERSGASYRAIPENFVRPTCSGRTALCNEVLNDTWVSLKQSDLKHSEKTAYEEYMYKWEDETLEKSIVFQLNRTAIRSLDAVQQKINRMSQQNKLKFRLDDKLGGKSTTHNKQAIKRLYGDKAPDVIEGLKGSPATNVSLVLKRLRYKNKKLKEARKREKKIWTDQIRKYYLRSIDHQSRTFKPKDIEMLNPQNLIHEIKTISEERRKLGKDDMDMPAGPHMRLLYQNKDLLKDAANLIMHHVNRQTRMQKEEKQKIKELMQEFVVDLFCFPCGGEVGTEEDSRNLTPANVSPHVEKGSEQKDGVPTVDKPEYIVSRTLTEKDGHDKLIPSCSSGISSMENSIPGDMYTLLFANNNWYLFFRLHHILCERLHRIKQRSLVLIEEMKREIERESKKKEPQPVVNVEPYYSDFLELVKYLLDRKVNSDNYEDKVRWMFEMDAYITFTMDKVIQNIVCQLKHIVGDEICTRCTALFLEEQKCDAAGGLCATASQRDASEATYQKKAESHLTGENCFKVILYKNEAKLTIELMDKELDQPEHSAANLL